MVEKLDAVYWLKACLLGNYPLMNSYDIKICCLCGKLLMKSVCGTVFFVPLIFFQLKVLKGQIIIVYNLSTMLDV